ncbi:hypothetical protein I545_6157 [Mycobacterium kansasii 662]|uniref:Uncharacterized protein n=4 Tax=Mycobacterium TaxID=1763 RepID=A0A1V3X2F9_MYCKA|nr:hypothetical protein MKAN_01110 [Mycobacterium kansasii ATCC 12478]ETZ99456.1 hypothetical protein I547_5717 [Mycobacterium kansasii 824]EUA09142.1 hypothetical protein I545_6157 [Mycobacterium kansasii 662]KEP41540.1 hypothetical protein MKSMC1_33130 [Mycobacterium kansasii]VBA39374.1 hypothetical protein LAUMK136_02961 [Mycobacterium attenuatum]
MRHIFSVTCLSHEGTLDDAICAIRLMPKRLLMTIRMISCPAARRPVRAETGSPVLL